MSGCLLQLLMIRPSFAVRGLCIWYALQLQCPCFKQGYERIFTSLHHRVRCWSLPTVPIRYRTDTCTVARCPFELSRTTRGAAFRSWNMHVGEMTAGYRRAALHKQECCRDDSSWCGLAALWSCGRYVNLSLARSQIHLVSVSRTMAISSALITVSTFFNRCLSSLCMASPLPFIRKPYA